MCHGFTQSTRVKDLSRNCCIQLAQNDRFLTPSPLQWEHREGSGETYVVMGTCSLGELSHCRHVDAWKKHSSTPFTSSVSAKLKYGWTICANLSSASGFLPWEPACLGCCELLVQESSTRLPGVPKRWISDSKKIILWIYSSHTSFYQTCYLLQGLYMYSVQTVISPFSLRNHPPDLLSQYFCTVILSGNTDLGPRIWAIFWWVFCHCKHLFFLSLRGWGESGNRIPPEGCDLIVVISK